MKVCGYLIGLAFIQFIIFFNLYESDDSAFNPREGWLVRGMKGYRVLTGIDASYDEAKDICSILFSYHFGHSYSLLSLVSINSTEEQRLIYSLILASKHSHDQFWIGAREDEIHGLRWVDGQDVRWTNFVHIKKQSPSQRCVAIDATKKGRVESPGKWVFDHCASRKGIICQRA